MSRETEQRKNRERLCRQVHRILLVVETARRLNRVSLRELLVELKYEGVEVCERTLRRDVAILTRLGWLSPGTRGGRKYWLWVKPRGTNGL